MKTIAEIIHQNNGHLNILDSQGNTLYCEHSNGYWWKCEYDYQRQELYYENSTGTIIDRRP